MPPAISSPVREHQDILAVALAVVIKVIFFSLRVQLASMSVMICSIAIVVMLCAPASIFAGRSRKSWLLGVDLLLSVVLLADSLYFRFFHNVITIPTLLGASQLTGVTSSVLALLSTADLVFFMDLPLMIPYLIKKRTPRYLSDKTRLRQIAVVFTLCLVVLVVNASRALIHFDDNQYVGLTWDQTVLRKLGVVNFHLYDLYSFARQRGAQGDMVNAAPRLREWMDDRGQQFGDHLTGIAAGKNVIVVQLEALQSFLVGRSIDGQPITPNLNHLIESSIYFDNYFVQVGQGNTADAEFMTLNSLYPAAAGSNYVLRSKNEYQSLPMFLERYGYQGSYVFHANTPEFWNRDKMYAAQGITKFYNTSNFFNENEIAGMGLADHAMYEQVLSELSQLPEPYLSLIITLSGHYPYYIPTDLHGLVLPAGQYSSIFRHYLQAQHYADQALGRFIDQLKAQGIWDNSVLVVYGDHHGTGWMNEDLETFLELPQPLTSYDLAELNKVPLAIHLPGDIGAGVNHISGGQMDLYPTLLNLLGIDRTNDFFFGQDLLNTTDGFSAFRVWAFDGSFATDEVLYLAGWTGKFEDGTAYDRATGQAIPLDGLENYYRMALWQLHSSDLILSANGLPQLISQPTDSVD